MLDVMFDIPSLDDVRQVVISRETIEPTPGARGRHGRFRRDKEA